MRSADFCGENMGDSNEVDGLAEVLVNVECSSDAGIFPAKGFTFDKLPITDIHEFRSIPFPLLNAARVAPSTEFSSGAESAPSPP
jgi:hypothetical protein